MLSTMLMVLVAVIIVAVILWLINAYMPMPQPLRSIVNGVVILLLIIYLLWRLGAL